MLVGFTVRALAQSAARAGARPVAVDYFGDRDLRAVCPDSIALGREGIPYDPRSLAARAANLEWDGVLYTGGLENHPDVVAELARKAPVRGNSPAVLRAVRDWPALSAALSREGFRVPVTLPPGSVVPEQGAWLEKPLAGSGGAGIARAIPGSRTPESRLLQQQIGGRPGSALFVAGGGRATLLGATEMLTAQPAFGGGPFQYAGNILLPDPPYRAELERLCQWLTARYGLVGVNGVDFIDDGSGPVVLEVNPRYTAAMELLEEATGCSLFSLHLEGCKGDCPPPLPPWRGYGGKAILYADRPVTWRFGGDWAGEGLRDLPFPGDGIEPGQPVCTLLAQGESRDACFRSLVARARAVREEFCVGRNE